MIRCSIAIGIANVIDTAARYIWNINTIYYHLTSA